MNNNIKLSLINFLLFVYERYIYQDWSYINKIGKIVIKPMWFIRSILMWSLIVILFPLFYLRFRYDTEIERIKLEIGDIINESMKNYNNV
jgi:hypothetical protein